MQYNDKKLSHYNIMPETQLKEPDVYTSNERVNFF